MSGLQLEWQWAEEGSSAGPVVRPLVVLLPWIWSEPKYVNKYTSICHKLGWDVLVARWPMLALWFPPWSQALASSLLATLGQQLSSRGPRPVVFWCFSGAAKGVYASLLGQLACPSRLKPQQAAYAAAVLCCAVGQVYDSGPVDFSSDMGRKLLSPNSRPFSSSSDPAHSNSSISSSSSSSSSSIPATAAALAAAAKTAGAVALSAGVDAAAGTLDVFLMEWFDRDRDNMWSRLVNSPVGGPVLMLYSRGDELADAAQIASLASSLRRRGRSVLEQVWHDTPHVGHLRAHPQEYTAAVAYLLAQALQEWAGRSSRRWEGRALTQRWQQQQQQQQQEEEAGDTSTSQQAQQHPPAATTAAGSGAVSSNFCVPRQQQRSGQPGNTISSGSSADGGNCSQQQQQQQQQLVLQPTKGVCGTGRVRSIASRAHHNSSNSSSSSSSSSDGRQTATLVRSGTSGSSGAHVAAVVTPLPRSAKAAAAAAVGVVRISNWSATASAAASALGEGAGELADATLLSHSLRCLARSYLSSSSSSNPCPHPGCKEHQQQQQQLAASGEEQQQQQQQQPFMRRVVSRLRSRL